MKRLDNLSQIASRQLGGLEATPTLLAKIKLEAADQKRPRTMQTILRPALAVCAALVLVAGAVMTITPEKLTGIGPASTPNVLDSHSAGNPTMPTAEPRSLSAAPRGVISMSAGIPAADGTLFVQGENAPTVCSHRPKISILRCWAMNWARSWSSTSNLRWAPPA